MGIAGKEHGLLPRSGVGANCDRRGEGDGALLIGLVGDAHRTGAPIPGTGGVADGADGVLVARSRHINATDSRVE